MAASSYQDGNADGRGLGQPDDSGDPTEGQPDVEGRWDADDLPHVEPGGSARCYCK